MPNLDLYDSIEKAELSDVTKKIYRDRIQFWEKETEKTIFFVVTHPAQFLPLLEKKWAESLQTQKSYVAVILALYRYNPDLKTKHKAAYTKWYQKFQELHKSIEEKYVNNSASDKQMAGFVAFPDIVAKRDTLTSGSQERLLVSMYTYIPPLRADFNRVAIYRKKVPEQNPEDNYILLDPSQPSKLVLNEFKTKKKLSTIENILPDALVAEIEASLRNDPRTYLFCDRKKQPYSAHGYTQMANRLLKRIFAKPLTISLLRHSFINNLDFNRITVREREIIAQQMAHSVGMQDRYRLLMNVSNPKLQANCSCSCELEHTSGPNNE